MKLRLLSLIFGLFRFFSRKGLWVGVLLMFIVSSFGQDAISISGPIATNEGNSGTTSFVFNVTVDDGSADSEITFNYSTVDGTATVANSDFVGATSLTGTILIGDPGTTITIDVNGDTTLEPNETFSVEISNAQPVGTTITTPSAQATILNDDLAAISINDVIRNEGNSGTSLFQFTVSTQGNIAAVGDIDFTFSTQNGTATLADGDYTQATNIAATIPNGQSSVTISVVVAGDTKVEPDETFLVNLTNPVNATISDGTGQGTITNDDSQAISISDVTLAEGNSGTTSFNFVVSVVGGGNALSNITFDVNTANGTAIAPGDFTAITGGSGQINAGSPSTTVTVLVTGDTTPEANEGFTVNISNPVNATISDGSGAGSITNDDSQAISISDVTLAEGNSGTTSFNFVVSVVGGGNALSNITFDVNTANGTAIAPGDFTAVTGGSGQINAGSPSTTVTVLVTGDTTPEANEGFTVNISNPVNATISDGTGAGTITNDDSQAISISDVTLAEGNTGTTAFNFVVSVVGGGNALSNITFTVNTSNGSATVANNDYEAISGGSGQIDAGTSSTTVTVQVNGDTNPENDETFNVVISIPVNATITDDTGVGTIENDDSQTISINSVSQAEGSGGAFTPFNFVVSINGGANAVQAIDFRVNTNDGTATQPGDYTRINNQLFTIPAGQNSVQVPVSVVADGTPELNETFTVEISNPSAGADLGTAVGTGTITNDDSQSISISDVSLAEGNAGTTAFNFVVSVVGGGNALSNITFNVNTANGTAIAPGDFTAISGGTGTITAGNPSTTVTVLVNGDTTPETDEGFTVTINNPVNATISDGTGAGTITNDDSQSISISDVSLAEGNAGTTAFNFVVSVVGGGNALSNITFNVNTANGTAIAPGDFTAISGGTGTITAGNPSTTVTVLVNGDTTLEPTETFTVNISNPTNATITDGSGLGTIINNDTATLTITNQTVAENVAGGNMVFTVTLNNAVAAGTSVGYTFTSGTATGGGVDFTGTPGTLTFTGTVGETETINVPINNDLIVEGTENFTVSLGTPTNGVGVSGSPATGTITDNDSSTLTITDVSVAENVAGGNMVFTVTLGNEVVGGVQVGYSFSNGTATGGGTDFTAAPGNLTFTGTAGQTRNITVQIINDAIAEPDEAFTVSLGAPSNANVSVVGSPATGTIVNDDTNTISIADLTQNEGNTGTSAFNFVVSVNDGVQALQDIDFNYSTTAGTATAGSDYITVTNGSGTIAAGQTSTTVPVTVNGDGVLEANETFTVTLSSPSGATIADGSATGTIQNDDQCDAGDEAPGPDLTQPTDFCTEDTIPGLLDFVISTPPVNTELTFTTNPDLLDDTGYLNDAQIAVPTAGTYYAFYYDATNNCASPPLTITLVRNETPVLLSSQGDELCGPGELTLTAAGEIPNSITAPDINWYDAPTGGSLVFTGENFVINLSATTTYWVEAFANGCSSPRQEVIATVSPVVTAGTPSDGSACSVAANGPTLRDLDDRLLGEDAGTWAIESVPEGAVVNIQPGNLVDFEGQPDGTYSFRFTTTGAQLPCIDDSVVVNITVNDCDTDSDGDGLLDGVEAALSTNPNERDTDGDGIEDGVEVGPDTDNPLNEDGDEFIDALDSNTLDTDLDGVNDQQDPANDNPCIPNTDSALCTVDLEVVKTVDSPQASVGQQITFTVALNNLSDIDVTGIEVGDLLQSGFSYVSHTASAGTYDPLSGAWTVASLAALGSATLDITVSVQATGDYTNTAELLASLPLDGNPDNDQSTLTVEIVLPTGADLAITKFAQITPGGSLSDVRIAPLVGDRIRFIVTVTNISADATVTGIQVQDLISPEADTGFEYASHFYNPATLPAGAYNPETGIWNIASLAPGQSFELSIAAYVRREGDFTNTARILSPADADPSNNTASVVVEVNARTPADPGFIFNQFSPNGDGINDLLKIRLGRINSETGLEEVVIGSYSIQIFNRYGQSVFEGSNLNSEVIWDGFHKGSEAPAGTYFYVLQYTDEGGADTTVKGWIQLIR